MFPENLVQACIKQLTTGVKTIEVNQQKHFVNLTELSINETEKLQSTYGLTTTMVNGTNFTYYMTSRMVTIAGAKTYGGSTNILGLVVFSLTVGLILGRMGDKASVFVKWVAILNDVIMELVTWVMWYSPIGIWSLIAAKFSSMHDISGVFASLGLYMATVVTGLAIHAFLVLPLIYFLCTRSSPLIYAKGIVQALLTAFGTSSSSATLPVTFRCLEDNNKVDKRVTRYVSFNYVLLNLQDGTLI